MAKKKETKVEEETTATAAPVEKKEAPAKTITVKAEDLDVLMKEIKANREKIASMQDEQGVLRQVSDKARLARLDAQRAEGKIVKSVKLKTIDGRIVTKWKQIKDEVYFDRDNHLHEEQVKRVWFNDSVDDSDCVEIDEIDWKRAYKFVVGEVLSEGKNRDGDQYFTVRLEDGNEIDINKSFVN